MKPYNKLTPKEKAIRFIYSNDNIGRFRRKPRLDMRFNESKEIARWISRLQITEDERIRVRSIRNTRAKRRIENSLLQNWLNRPITIDVRTHGDQVKYIRPDHVHFLGGRNHWIKREDEKIILNILRKHRTIKPNKQ